MAGLIRTTNKLEIPGMISRGMKLNIAKSRAMIIGTKNKTTVRIKQIGNKEREKK